MPKAEAPTVSLTVETKDKSASDAVKDATQQTANTQPSVIIVEVLGYGGGDAGTGAGEIDAERARKDEEERRRRRNNGRQGLRQDPNSPAQVVGYGNLTEQQKRLLSDEEKRNL